MKKIIFFLTFIIVAVSINSQNLTDNQLISIVRNFENNQSLNNFKISYLSGFDYILELNRKSWSVDSNSLNVCMYINFDERQMNTKTGVLSKDVCKSIGLNYLNSKNISLIDFQIQEPETIKDGCYRFFFYKILDTNVFLMSQNTVSVEINATTGNIAGFGRNISDEYIYTDPLILTNNMALTIVEELYPNEQVNFQISAASYNSDYDTITRTIMIDEFGWIIVDAFSCNILDSFPYLNLQASKNIINKIEKYNNKHIFLKPDIKIKTYKEIEKDLYKINPKIEEINLILYNTENPKDINYIELSKDYVIDKVDKGIARMEVNGNKFIFRNGSYWCFINNKTYNMGGNCIIENGKLKLPEEFYKKVQDKDYQFFKK